MSSFRKKTLAGIVVVLVAAVCVFTGDRGFAQAGREQSLDPIRMFARTRLGRVPFLIAPIKPEEVTQYALILKLSEEQNAILHVFYMQYLNQSVVITQSDLRELANLSYVGDELPPSELVESRAIFWDMRKAIFDSYREFEETFIGNLGTFLSPEQLPLLTRVRFHRLRAWNVNQEQRIRGARIDLSRYVEDLDLSVVERNAVDELLWNYEREITPLYVSLGEAYQARRLDLKRLLETPEALVMPDTASSIPGERAQDKREELLASGARLEKQIRDVNKRFLPQLLAALPEDAAEELRTRYNNEAYRKIVYPDTTDPKNLYRIILSSLAENEDIYNLVEGEWRSYRSRYLRICNNMEEEFEKMQEQRAKTHLSTVSRYLDYKENMRYFWIDRWGLNREFAKRLKALLPDDVKPEHDPEIQRYLKKHEQVGKRTLSPDFPRPVI